MNFHESRFYTIYYHELYGLACSLKEKCQQVFDAAIVPEDGYAAQVNPEIHSVISSLLSDAANIKKLIVAPDIKPKGESEGRFIRRKQRANDMSEFLRPLNIKEILNHKVRNTLEHFDEYLDDANYELTSQPKQGRYAAYNMIASHWEYMNPKLYPVRLYISSERKFYNMKWSVDIGAIHSEALSIIGKCEKDLNIQERCGQLIKI